jgi:hypothetical protein
MAVVASATGAFLTGGALATGTIGAGLLGGAVLGAGAGALYSGITGDGNILNSALTGALLGGTVGGIGAAFAPAAAGGTGLTATAPLTGTGALAPGAASTVSTASPAYAAAAKGSLAATAAAPAGITATQAAAGLGAVAPGAAPVASTFGTLAGASAPAGLTATQAAAGLGAGSKTAAAGLTGKQMLATGLLGTTALSLLGGRQGSGTAPPGTPSYIRPYTYSSTPVAAGGDYPSPYPTGPLYDMAGNPILDTRERNYFDQKFTAGEPYKAANGGLMAAYQSGGPVERMSMMNTAMNPQGGLYPQGMIDMTQYASPTQRPVSSELMMSAPAYDRSNPMLMAKGGQAEEDESYKDRMKRIKEMTSMLDEIRETGRVAPPDLGEYVPTMREYKPSKLNVMAMPQAFVDAPDTKGVMGRIGGAYALDRDTQILGGLSGFAGRDRGALTVRPSTADLGIARKMGPGILAAQYERSLTGQQPPRYMANYNIPYAEGGITYDAATQRYSGLPSMGGAPAGDSTPLSADLIAQLTPQYQAANPNQFAYDPVKQRYSAATPSMSQLNAFKAFQDQKAADDAADAAAQAYQPYDGGGGAAGGLMPYNLGGYSDGGRLLRGPGDGVSDDIPAVIGNRQPARLADGEFVIPARIVSELGNGSTDAGAKRLYAMMDRIQSGRKKTIGKGNVAKDTKAKKHLLA